MGNYSASDSQKLFATFPDRPTKKINRVFDAFGVSYSDYENLHEVKKNTTQAKEDNTGTSRTTPKKSYKRLERKRLVRPSYLQPLWLMTKMKKNNPQPHRFSKKTQAVVKWSLSAFDALLKIARAYNDFCCTAGAPLCFLRPITWLHFLSGIIAPLSSLKDLKHPRPTVDNVGKRIFSLC